MIAKAFCGSLVNAHPFVLEFRVLKADNYLVTCQHPFVLQIIACATRESASRNCKEARRSAFLSCAAVRGKTFNLSQYCNANCELRPAINVSFHCTGSFLTRGCRSLSDSSQVAHVDFFQRLMWNLNPTRVGLWALHKGYMSTLRVQIHSVPLVASPAV